MCLGVYSQHRGPWESKGGCERRDEALIGCHREGYVCAGMRPGVGNHRHG